ncbi:MAG: hypothetical protein AAB489_05100 [Patescibacteria group bacterium]
MNAPSSRPARWNRFFFRSAPPHALAVFRIGLGLFLLLVWGLRLPHVPMLYSSEGVVLPLMDATDVPLFLIPFFSVPPAFPAWLLYGTLLTALVGLTVGLFARAAAFIAFLLTAYFWNLSLHIFGTSFDQLFLFTLFVLSFSPSDRGLSLLMKLKHGSFLAQEPVCVLPQRILALQITATYLGVGWQKLYLPDWQSGRILYQGFTGRWATPVALFAARHLPMWAYDALVELTVWFEFMIPFGLWIRRFGIRWWFFLSGTVFHTLIALFLGIWWFLILIPAYILFFEPEEVESWFERKTKKTRKAQKTQKSA